MAEAGFRTKTLTRGDSHSYARKLQLWINHCEELRVEADGVFPASGRGGGEECGGGG